MRQNQVPRLLAAALMAALTVSAAPRERLTRLWETKAGLKMPESVLYDPAGKVLYVSSINENPAEKDGNGYISKLSLNGDFIALKWVTGLSGPKGLGIARDKLYVSDIDELVEIDLAKAKVLARYRHETAKWLNDVAIGPDGTVYASDGKAVFTLKNGTLKPLVDTKEMDGANGLVVLDTELVIGLSGRLSALDLKTKALRTVVPDTGGIDGVVALGDGRFVISDWAGKIQVVQPGQPNVVLLDTTRKGINAADLGFIAADKTLLVPTGNDDHVVAYRLE